MTLDEFRAERLRTSGYYGNTNDRLIFGAIGVAGESGEIAEFVKKKIYHGKPEDFKELALEIGDCIWYLDHIAETIGLTLDEVLQMNVDKLRARWPDGFKRG